MADSRQKLLYKDDLINLYKKAKAAGKILLLKVDHPELGAEKHCISIGTDAVYPPEEANKKVLAVLHLAGINKEGGHYTFMTTGSGLHWEVVQAAKKDLLLYLDNPLPKNRSGIPNEFGDSPSEIIANILNGTLTVMEEGL
jgi:hypothetical protein